MACEINRSLYIPEKKNLPIDTEHLSAWYSNLLMEVDNAGYSSLEVKLFRDQRNYYGKYFSPESRNFFLRHFAQNLAKTINYLFASGENDVKFLEIGCGCGNQLLLAAFLGAETVGCDIRPDACELINKRKAFYEAQAKRTLNISLICEDAFKVDWERWGKFDAVNFLFSFNDIQPNEKTLELAAGLLKPGGRIVFQETNQSNYYNWMMRRRDEMAPLEVARALKKLNFRIDSLYGGYVLPPVFWRFIPRTLLTPTDQSLCHWFFLAPSYHLMAEKTPVSKAHKGITLKNNARVLYVEKDTLYAQIGDSLCSSRDTGETWEPLSIELTKGCASFSRLFGRLTRRGIHSVLLLSDGKMLVVAKNRICKVDTEKRVLLNTFNIPKGSRPLFVSQGQDGMLYWGEYFQNPKREKVDIYASGDNGDTWQVIYTFKKNQVRHVHGVFCDPYDGNIWVTTGDKDEESAVWVTGNQFRSLEKVVWGTQQARALQLIFTQEHVYFGTETPFEPNHIFRMNKASGELEMLASVEGSVYWGCKAGTYLFFSTAVEPSSVNKSRYASAWGSLDGVSWQCINRFKKDLWPIRYFQIGQILFPQGENQTGYLFYTPFATECDQTIQRIRTADLLSAGYEKPNALFDARH